MTRRCAACSRSPALAAPACSRGRRPRRADRRARRRAHGDVRLSDLPRRGAPADPLADGRDRRGPGSASAGRSRATSSALASHDVALRSLGRRARAVLRAHRAARARRARLLPRGRPARAHGRRRRRPAEPLPPRPPAAARGAPRRRGRVGAAAAFVPAAGARARRRAARRRLAVPASPAPLGRRAGQRGGGRSRRRCRPSSSSSSGARAELVAFGADEARARPHPRGRPALVRARAPRRVRRRHRRRRSQARRDRRHRRRRARRRGRRIGAGASSTGAHRDARRCSRSARSRRSRRSRPRRASCPPRVAAGRRVLEIADRPVAVSDRLRRPRRPPGRSGRARGVTVRYPAPPVRRSKRSACGSPRARGSPSSGPAGPARRRSRTSCCASSTRPGAGSTIGGRDERDYRLEDVGPRVAVAGQDAHLFPRASARTCCLARPGRAATPSSRTRCGSARLLGLGRGLPDGLGHAGSARTGGRSPAGSASGSCSPARSSPGARCWCSTSRRRISIPRRRGARSRDVFAAAGDRTVLLITHRPEGLDLVDEVVTLDGGQIAGAAA